MVVALIGAGGVGFWVYKTIQARLSPPAIREAAEKSLSEATSHPVSVGEASLSLTDSVLVFRNIGIKVEHEAFLTIDRIDARAESLTELNDRKFVELTVTKPKIILKRDSDRWNLEAFLDPLLKKIGSPSIVESSPEEIEKKPIPITHIQVTDAEVTVSLDWGESYSGINIGNLDLRRENIDMPWALRLKDSKVRLNPTQEEWPLLEVVDLVKGMIPKRENGTSEKPDPGIDKGGPLEALGTIALENVGFELIHPKQEITLEGFSFEASRFFEIIRVQSGTLEKKSPPKVS